MFCPEDWCQGYEPRLIGSTPIQSLIYNNKRRRKMKDTATLKNMLGHGIEEDVLAIRKDMIETAAELRREADNASAMFSQDAYSAKTTAGYLEHYTNLLDVK